MSQKNLLVLIGADPRTSSRPGEAVRIAAGVGAWGKVLVSIYLQGPAVRCLTEFREELEGGNLLAQYLPMIPQHGGQIYVDAGNPLLREANGDVPLTELNPESVSNLVSETARLMNFDASLSSLK